MEHKENSVLFFNVYIYIWVCMYEYMWGVYKLSNSYPETF